MDAPNLTDAWVRLVEDCRLRRYRQLIANNRTGKVRFTDAEESIDLSAHVVFDRTPVFGIFNVVGGNGQLPSLVEAAMAANFPMPYDQCAVIQYQSPPADMAIVVGIFDRVDEAAIVVRLFHTDRRLRHPWTAAPAYAEIKTPTDDKVHIIIADDVLLDRDAEDTLMPYIQGAFAEFYAMQHSTGEIIQVAGSPKTTRHNTRRQRLNLPEIAPVRSIRIIHLLPHVRVRSPSEPTTPMVMEFKTPAWAVRGHLRRRPKSGGYAVIPAQTRHRVGLAGDAEPKPVPPPWYEVRP